MTSVKINKEGEIMKTQPKTLSGFMELFPNEQVVFDNIKNTIIDTYKKLQNEDAVCRKIKSRTTLIGFLKKKIFFEKLYVKRNFL